VDAEKPPAGRTAHQAGPGQPTLAGPASPAGARFSPVQLARLLGVAEPTAEQAAIISAPPAPLAVIAGAGSGKSETMAARLVWLVANGYVRPERVLGLTFTRKAAAELAGRVRARLDGLRRVGLVPAPARDQGNGVEPGQPGVNDLAGDPMIATYHSYAGRLISDHALREALEPTIRLITPAVAWQLAAKVVAAYDGPMDAVEWAPVTVTAAVLDLSAELAEHLRDPDELLAAGDWLRDRHAAVPPAKRRMADSALNCQRVREQLLPLAHAYARAKAEREVIDYGDQMALAARIAVAHPEVGVAERGRYQVVLLDEFQDTSHAQLVLLRALFGGGHPVTAVGDPCQSIYGWRGASAGNMKRFAAYFPPAADEEPLAAVRLLSTSFRNTGRILDAAAAIQQDLRLDAPDVPRLIAPPDRAERGAVVCALLQTSAAEAQWVAGQVCALLALPAGIAPDGRPWPDGRTSQVRPSDVAVLCRKRAQFGALRSALEAEGIPVEVVGLGGLLTVPEVADIVATLRVLHSPVASDSLARMLTSPRWRIGPQDLVALGTRARQLSRDTTGSAASRSAASGSAASGSSASGATAAGSAASGATAGGSAASGATAGGPAEAGPAGTGPAGTGPAGGARAEDGRFGAGRVGGRWGEGVPDERPVIAEDYLTRAVANFTAETDSLVEALDDLGGAAAYSDEGYARLLALGAELRGLRRHVGRPLQELVIEVERVLGLDVEVVARPGIDPVAARADLDAFADAAAAFAGDAQEPTLGAFLAYLTAAETEEFGLEAGRVSDADSVKLATVHSAKGLQWAAVVVPGLAAGTRAQNFPARPRLATRWTDNPRLLPFWLRGDAEDLPELAGLDAESMNAFGQACADRNLAEERRLAYVAVTRSAYWLACSGYWWGTGKSALGPSPFLREVRAACEAGAGQVAHWAREPGADEENPVLAEPLTARWPVPGSAAGARYHALREAGEMVRAAEVALAAEAAEAAEAGPVAQTAADAGQAGGLSQVGGARETDLVAGWIADTDLLLAERSRRRLDGPVQVDLPRRIGVSALVTMTRDPAELAARVRRPMPQPPAPRAQRGTAFHRWLEERFGQIRLIDPDELTGAVDADLVDGDADLADLKERFETGAWGQRWPADVEVRFETPIGDRLIRGRIDAIFADAPGGGFDVVDWKTGRPPRPGPDERAVAVQLAAYRLAWAALAGVRVDQVRAAFYYVRDDLTVRPADLLDAAGLAALIESVPVSDAATG
jgi:DNA helicase-2/ATP-dependent DNA helicase PcrA